MTHCTFWMSEVFCGYSHTDAFKIFIPDKFGPTKLFCIVSQADPAYQIGLGQHCIKQPLICSIS